MIRLFLCSALLSTATCDSWYPTPSPYTQDNIMSGNFKYKRVPGDAKVWEEYMKVWGVKMPEENQIDDQGKRENVSNDEIQILGKCLLLTKCEVRVRDDLQLVV